MKKTSKLLLIGWDAADWLMIQPLLDQGKMPALKSLINSGSKGNISTLNPPLSPMLWTSIATGKRAYDHGIHGFADYNSTTQKVDPIKATTRKSKTFWNILNEADIKTNVVNWWPSHPAEKINGVCVSNFYHTGAPAYGENWEMDAACVFPEEFFQELKDLRLHPGELTLAHIQPFIPEAANLDPENDKVLKPLLRVLAHCCSVHNAVTHLMENTEWDVTAVYYEAIDHFSHLAMKYHPPQQDGISDKEYNLFKGIMEAAYRFHDMMLDRLLVLAGEDCNVLLLSDHGFQSGDLRMVELPNIPAAPALEHRKYGIFVASGPDFQEGKEVYGSSLLDITPTILNLYDLPVGDDMEGKVIPDIWKNFDSVGSIPSWELTEGKTSFVGDLGGDLNQDLIDQLEELGYISVPENDEQKQLERELEYNLIQSLIDGRKFERARKQAEAYYKKFSDARAGEVLATIYLHLGLYDELETFVREADKDEVNPAYVFLMGLKELYVGKVDDALESFKGLEARGAKSVQLFNRIGHSLFLSGLYNQAIQYFDKTLELESANANALTGKAQNLVELTKYEQAIPLLEQSLELTFFQPNAHYLMAVCFNSLGYEEEALVALKLTLKQAPKHQKAKTLSSKLGLETLEKKESVLVVSGLPRSGTSMMMQILGKGGLTVLTDGKREDDDHNPKGYYEFEKVKNLGAETEWIKEARGKVLKVVSPLLRYLPSNEEYKVIWLKRPLTEIILSQERMKGREKSDIMKVFPFDLAMNMQKEEERLHEWVNAQPNMKSLEIDYYDCLKKPKDVFKKIEDFIDKEIKIDGIDAIDAGLHRNKLGE